MVDFMIDHHLRQGVDHIIVTDNGSLDGTYERLDELSRAGLIELRREPASDFSQYRWVTAMARWASVRYAADWVINADADELFVSNEGSLRSVLGGIADEIRLLSAERHDFVPIDRPCALPPPLEMPFRKSLSLNINGVRLPPKVIHRGDPGVFVGQGNHRATGPSLTTDRVPCSIQVCHYPIRSYAQFERKARNGGSGYAANRDLPPRAGRHKRHWYELLQRGLLEKEYQTRYFYDAARLAKDEAAGAILRDTTVVDLYQSGHKS